MPTLKARWGLPPSDCQLGACCPELKERTTASGHPGAGHHAHCAREETEAHGFSDLGDGPGGQCPRQGGALSLSLCFPGAGGLLTSVCAGTLAWSPAPPPSVSLSF